MSQLLLNQTTNPGFPPASKTSFWADSNGNLNYTLPSGATGLVGAGVAVATITSSATPSIDTDNTALFTITALAVPITSMTSGLSGTPRDGQKLMIRIKDNGTAQTIAWGASFASSGIATLLATTVINKTHYVGLIWDAAASTWDCVGCDPVGR